MINSNLINSRVINSRGINSYFDKLRGDKLEGDKLCIRALVTLVPHGTKKGTLLSESARTRN